MERAPRVVVVEYHDSYTWNLVHLVATVTGGLVDPVAPAHGEMAGVYHDGTGLFAGIPSFYPVVRYHSLAAPRVPDDLVVTATTGDVVMGVQRRTLPLHDVQFHPESALSEHGTRLVANFIDGASGRRR